MLVIGNSKVHYADRIIDVQKQALSFSNPQIPYKWEHTDHLRSGVFCIFNQHFFHQYGNLNQYSIFQPGGTHIFELGDKQLDTVNNIFQRMFQEINSDYVHKYDVLRTLVFELIHFAMKMEPSGKFEKQHINAAQRISTLFMELLERQFPIDDTHQNVQLRTGVRLREAIKYSRQPFEPRSKRNDGENDLEINCRACFAGSKNTAQTK
jgi:hypothetical protein